MKKSSTFNWFYHHPKKTAAVLILLFTLISTTFSQLPPFYNFDQSIGANSFPFNVTVGKQVQWLILAGDLNQPAPAPSGTITKIYFRANSTGSPTFTNLTIKLGQASITTLPTGALYTGQMDTVYYRASINISSTINTFFSLTLDRPYTYDNTKALIIDVQQCGITGAGFTVSQQTYSPFRRNYLTSAPCPQAYSGQDGTCVGFGVDITLPPTTCSKYANSWCPINTYPVLPGATYFNCAAWLGDTLYVQVPTTAGVGATTIYRYTWNGSWSTGVPCLVAVAGASLTACSGKLYLIGGGAAITAGTNNVQIYNPATGTWTAGAPMPAALAAHGAANWGDSVIFIVGGPYTGAGTNLAVHYYRVASNTWGTIAASLPSGQGRRTFAMGITNGNKIVIACGFNTAYLNSTYVGTIGSDATQIVWSAGANAPQLLSRPAGVGYQNTMFLSGGDTNGTAGKNDKVYCYNVNANSWFNTILSNPNAVSNSMNALTARCINDTLRLFQPGGYPASAVASNIFVVTGCGPVFVGIENISLIPQRYNLRQNYPNPFNPKTIIEFSIPKSENVRITVFDILGREVMVLVNDVFKAGSYTVDFNASQLASGIYMYRINAGDFTDTKKMMLIK